MPSGRLLKLPPRKSVSSRSQLVEDAVRQTAQLRRAHREGSQRGQAIKNAVRQTAETAGQKKCFQRDQLVEDAGRYVAQL